MLHLSGLEGDRVADARVHGGPDKAICIYSAEHREAWRRELAMPALGPGAFGENLAVSGGDEHTVCIGDTFRFGEAVVQVSQPRGPCWKIGRRWSRPDLPKLVLETGRTGWYVRVLREGRVEAGQDCALVERPHPEWTIARVNDATYRPGARHALDVAALASCAALARSWRLSLARRLQEGLAR